MEELTPECIIFCQIILKLNIKQQTWHKQLHQEVREVKKKKKKNILMDLIHNWGGGVSVRIHFSCIFFTFNVKNMSKNGKRTIKQW